MKKTGIIILSVVIVSACKTTRETVKTQTEEQSSQRITQVVKSVGEETEVKTNITKQRTFETDSTVIIEKEITYSKPDTSGLQYAEKVVERKITTGKKKISGQQIDDKKTSSESTQTEIATSATTENKTATTQEVKTKEKKSWPWKLAVITGVIVCVVLGIIKRHWFFRFIR